MELGIQARTATGFFEWLSCIASGGCCWAAE